MKKIISPTFRAQIALEAVKDIKTPNQIGSEHDVHPVQVGLWRKHLIDHAHVLFSEKQKHNEKEKETTALIERLYRIIGQRDEELDWLKKKLHSEP